MNLTLSLAMSENRARGRSSRAWRANELAKAERQEQVEYHVETGLVPQDMAVALRRPLAQHGVAANRLVLETAAEYSHEQGLTLRRLGLAEIFAASAAEQ